jgi:hypothetical protein
MSKRPNHLTFIIIFSWRELKQSCISDCKIEQVNLWYGEVFIEKKLSL